MDIPSVVVLLLAGTAMGWVNNLAGAGGILGLLALEFAGLSLGEANTSMRLSAIAIGVMGMLSFRLKGHRIPGRVWLFALTALPGAALGAGLAVRLPETVYVITLVVVLSLLLLQQTRPPRILSGRSRRHGVLSAALFSLVGLHMGFVQVGTGLLAILALSHVFSRDMVEINTAKMALIIVSACTSNAVLVFEDAVHWTPALLLALGCGIGSFLAARWSMAKGHETVRKVVLIIGGAALARFLWLLAGHLFDA